MTFSDDWRPIMTFDFASDEKLLDIDAICKKLSISRSTFDRLRKPREEGLIAGAMYSGATDDSDYAGLPPFPEPTLTLGRSPRWSVSVLNAWIASPAEKRVVGVRRLHRTPRSAG
jgi:predicted DNA-binding transcriptional regulator AlpA